MVTLMKFIYIFTSIIDVTGSIACTAFAAQAHKKHNKYARNGWFVATVLWIILFVYRYKVNFCM